MATAKQEHSSNQQLDINIDHGTRNPRSTTPTVIDENLPQLKVVNAAVKQVGFGSTAFQPIFNPEDHPAKSVALENAPTQRTSSAKENVWQPVLDDQAERERRHQAAYQNWVATKPILGGGIWTGARHLFERMSARLGLTRPYESSNANLKHELSQGRALLKAEKQIAKFDTKHQEQSQRKMTAKEINSLMQNELARNEYLQGEPKINMKNLTRELAEKSRERVNNKRMENSMGAFERLMSAKAERNKSAQTSREKAEKAKMAARVIAYENSLFSKQRAKTQSVSLMDRIKRTLTNWKHELQSIVSSRTDSAANAMFPNKKVEYSSQRKSNKSPTKRTFAEKHPRLSEAVAITVLASMGGSMVAGCKPKGFTIPDAPSASTSASAAPAPNQEPSAVPSAIPSVSASGAAVIAPPVIAPSSTVSANPSVAPSPAPTSTTTPKAKTPKSTSTQAAPSYPKPAPTPSTPNNSGNKAPAASKAPPIAKTPGTSAAPATKPASRPKATQSKTEKAAQEDRELTPEEYQEWVNSKAYDDANRGYIAATRAQYQREQKALADKAAQAERAKLKANAERAAAEAKQAIKDKKVDTTAPDTDADKMWSEFQNSDQYKLLLAAAMKKVHGSTKSAKTIEIEAAQQVEAKWRAGELTNEIAEFQAEQTLAEKKKQKKAEEVQAQTAAEAKVKAHELKIKKLQKRLAALTDGMASYQKVPSVHPDPLLTISLTSANTCHERRLVTADQKTMLDQKGNPIKNCVPTRSKEVRDIGITVAGFLDSHLTGLHDATAALVKDPNDKTALAYFDAETTVLEQSLAVAEKLLAEDAAVLNRAVVADRLAEAMLNQGGAQQKLNELAVSFQNRGIAPTTRVILNRNGITIANFSLAEYQARLVTLNININSPTSRMKDGAEAAFAESNLIKAQIDYIIAHPNDVVVPGQPNPVIWGAGQQTTKLY